MRQTQEGRTDNKEMGRKQGENRGRGSIRK